MMRTCTFRRLEAGLLFLLALLLNSGGAALRTQEGLSEKVVRLHVLANSDAPADQSMKLQVRDRILRETAPLLSAAGSRAEAEAALRARLPELSQAARDALDACGCSYPVALELREAEFPTRDYGAFALPAGRYVTLRAVIGAGAGRNWWCVVFPPLCGAVGAGDASGDGAEGAIAAADFTADEIALITRKNAAYALKFRVAECWESLRQRLTKSQCP
ncbi:MAG: stage II sporulation protein R [Oscillibacter sp.]|nr:stage II sporulation protein R [Oscillibacter sp.]